MALTPSQAKRLFESVMCDERAATPEPDRERPNADGRTLGGCVRPVPSEPAKDDRHAASTDE